MAIEFTSPVAQIRLMMSFAPCISEVEQKTLLVKWSMRMWRYFLLSSCLQILQRCQMTWSRRFYSSVQVEIMILTIFLLLSYSWHRFRTVCRICLLIVPCFWNSSTDEALTTCVRCRYVRMTCVPFKSAIFQAFWKWIHAAVLSYFWKDFLASSVMCVELRIDLLLSLWPSMICCKVMRLTTLRVSDSFSKHSMTGFQDKASASRLSPPGVCTILKLCCDR